jgi:hypothetical protein
MSYEYYQLKFKIDLQKNIAKKIKNAETYIKNIEQIYIDTKIINYNDYMLLVFVKHYEFKNDYNLKYKFNAYLHYNEDQFNILIKFVKTHKMQRYYGISCNYNLEYIFTYDQINDKELKYINFINNFNKIKNKINTLKYIKTQINNIITYQLSFRKKSYSSHKTNILLIKNSTSSLIECQNNQNLQTCFYMLKTTINSKKN